MSGFVADAADAGERFDVIVARKLGVSRAVAARLIDSGAATYNDAPAPRSLRVESGARIDAVAATGASPHEGEDIAVRAAFEDEWLIVVSKPAGLVVHPAPGHVGGTLVNALLASSSPAGGDDDDRPGIVHRLDAGTSGLMIVAKHPDAFARLTEQMSAREVSRVYLALVAGVFDTDTATIDAPIGRSPKHRKKMAIVAGGKPAVTNVTVLERHKETSFLEVRPHTGRTHQIRVHLAAAEHPVVGDPVYGKTRRLAMRLGLDRPFLHAARLRFIHPMTGEEIALEDPLPADLTEALRRVR